MNTKPIRCAKCKTDANVEVVRDIPASVKCPRCGESQSYLEFQQSLGKQVAVYAHEVLDEHFAKMARNNQTRTGGWKR